MKTLKISSRLKDVVTSSSPLRKTQPEAGGRGRPLSLAWWAATRLGQAFSADLRSLALLRIVLGALVLMDLAGRVPNLRIHYTDEGVLPRELVVSSMSDWRWSAHLMNGTFAFQAALFLLTAAAAMGLIVGYRTRVMTIIVWAMVMSIQIRNPYLQNGGDMLLRVLLFWAMLLPLGARWSIDSRVEAVPRLNRYLSVASVALFLQIAFMYWFTAILKSSPEWRTDGTALYYALSAEHITRPFGEYLQQFPDVLRLLTHATLALEFVAPILLFSPVLNGPLRTIGAASIMSLHVGIYLMMDVGLFPWTSALCMLCFLPTWFWDDLTPHVYASVQRRYAIVRQFRGVWTRTAQGVTRGLERLGGATWALQAPSAYSSAGQKPSPAITDESALAGRRPDADAGQKTVQPISLRSSLLANLVAALLLAFVFAWNIMSVSAFTMPRETYPVAHGLGLYQKWSMFSPRPPGNTSWYTVRGVLRDGTQVDLLTPIIYGDLERVSRFSWEQPDDIVGTYYRDKYWRKYLSSIALSHRDDERRAFAAYSCRTWNAHYGGDAHLVGLQIISVSDPIEPPGEDDDTQSRRRLIDEFRCR